jgi:hypothetical protein
MNDSIVALATSNTAYIDDDFYKEKFGENLKDEQKKAFPVNIVSMKINWIISTKEGKEFLWAILQSERLEYYEIQALQIIIEFLYQKSKSLLLNYLLPLYLLQGLVFFIVIVLQEYRKNQYDGEDIGIN